MSFLPPTEWIWVAIMSVFILCFSFSFHKFTTPFFFSRLFARATSNSTWKLSIINSFNLLFLCVSFSSVQHFFHHCTWHLDKEKVEEKRKTFFSIFLNSIQVFITHGISRKCLDTHQLHRQSSQRLKKVFFSLFFFQNKKCFFANKKRKANCDSQRLRKTVLAVQLFTRESHRKLVCSNRESDFLFSRV